MSGINAHVLLGAASQPGVSSAVKLAWQRVRVWAGPFLHHLAHPAAVLVAGTFRFAQGL